MDWANSSASKCSLRALNYQENIPEQTLAILLDLGDDLDVVVKQNFNIVGTGSYFPSKVVSAEEIDSRTHQPKGWSREYVGVESRHECVAPETQITMGAEAIKLAMADAQVDWPDIDCIIDCSTCQFRPIPCNATHYQAAFGDVAKSISCFDVQSTCLGSILAIRNVNALFASGDCQTAIVVASESSLAGVNWSQPESASLFGDGAAAMVLQRVTPDNSMAVRHETFAEHIELCKVDGGGFKLPFFEYTPDRKSEFLFNMDGPSLFRVARKLLPPMVHQIMADMHSHTGDNQLHVIPHQASPKAIEFVRKLFNFSAERYHVAVRVTGNTIAASIPMMIDRTRREASIDPGDWVMLLGTSAGYSQAAMIFRY